MDERTSIITGSADWEVPSTYTLHLPPIAKTLLEETNKRYMFYEFILEHTRALTYTLGKRDPKRVYAKVPAWLYDIARKQNLNGVGIYLASAGWMGFLNAKYDPGADYVTVQVYRNFFRVFGNPLFSESFKPQILLMTDNPLYRRPWKVFDQRHRLAKRLKYVKSRYRLTRTNTMLLYLAFFLRFYKDTMRRD